MATATEHGGPLVVALASLKGGVGKTTTAVHLAAHLALGVGDRPSLQTLLVDGDRIRTATAWARPGLLPFRVVSPAGMHQAGSYQAVVIDSRGGMEAQDLLELAESSDLVLLPTSADLAGMDGMAQTVDLLQGAGVPPERYAALLTRVRPGRRLDEGRGGLQDLEVPALQAQVRESLAFQDAVNTGVLVKDVKHSKTSTAAWDDYGQVADELLRRLGR